MGETTKPPPVVVIVVVDNCSSSDGGGCGEKLGATLTSAGALIALGLGAPLLLVLKVVEGAPSERVDDDNAEMGAAAGATPSAAAVLERVTFCNSAAACTSSCLSLMICTER